MGQEMQVSSVWSYSRFCHLRKATTEKLLKMPWVVHRLVVVSPGLEFEVGAMGGGESTRHQGLYRSSTFSGPDLHKRKDQKIKTILQSLTLSRP